MMLQGGKLQGPTLGLDRLDRNNRAKTLSPDDVRRHDVNSSLLPTSLVVFRQTTKSYLRMYKILRRGYAAVLPPPPVPLLLSPSLLAPLLPLLTEPTYLCSDATVLATRLLAQAVAYLFAGL
jgi:hypothetical protein